MSSKLNFWQVQPTYYYAVFVLYMLFICISHAVAVNRISYKEDATSTPLKYKDYKTISKSGSSEVEDKFRANSKDFKEGELPKFLNRMNFADPREPKLDRVKSNSPRRLKNLDRVKSVSPGEKTMKQSDVDDDDDDDGGEYDGLGENGAKTQTNCEKKDPVPVMIIRQLDMVAMGIPAKDSPKDKNGNTMGMDEKNKGGMQGRWRESCREREQPGSGSGSKYKFNP